MPIINLKCKKCKETFDSDVGKVTHPTKIGGYPVFEKDVVCSNCGRLKLKEVELTELGQSQMTESYLQE